MGRDDSDVELMRRIASGDEAAMRTLWSTYGQRLYAFAVHLTRNPALADEVVQESLLAAWQGAKRYRGDSALGVWLLGIAYHKGQNALRRRPTESLDEQAERLPAADPEPLHQAEVDDRQRLLRAGLECLSPEHRLALDLVFYHGLSLAEAAQVCGCPVGTIKSRLNHAKSRLREHLCAQGLALEDLA